MTNTTLKTMQVRTMQDVFTEIMERLGSLQNVLYHHSARQTDIAAIERDVKILTAAQQNGDEMLAAAMMLNITLEEQRDAALNAVQQQRASWIQFAAKHERLVLAAGIALDKDEIDEAMVAAALDYLVGAIKGDASEGAQWDVARALQRLGEELSQKGV